MFEINICVSISVGNKIYTVATDFKEIRTSHLRRCVSGWLLNRDLPHYAIMYQHKHVVFLSATSVL